MPLRLPPSSEHEAFATQHALFSPGAASTDLLALLQELLHGTSWVPDPITSDRFHFDHAPVDLSPVARQLLDPSLLTELQALTGIDGISHFVGQIKRIRPGDRFPWHRDHRKGQRLGLSLCLSSDFDGGAFEMRWRWDDAVLFRCQPRSPGDLHLIDVADPRLVHQVTPVTRGERVALAGWWVGSA